jgi:hypothetical protein
MLTWVPLARVYSGSDRRILVLYCLDSGLYILFVAANTHRCHRFHSNCIIFLVLRNCRGAGWDVSPWCIAIWASRRFNLSGAFYFGGTGAISTFAIGCVALSLLPDPELIEDQTFFESLTIAAERQGLCLILTGFIGGLTYWYMSERRGRFPAIEPRI